jgi:hypothetical protein
MKESVGVELEMLKDNIKLLKVKYSMLKDKLPLKQRQPSSKGKQKNNALHDLI